MEELLKSAKREFHLKLDLKATANLVMVFDKKNDIFQFKDGQHIDRF
jgi:hypothetical protein